MVSAPCSSPGRESVGGEARVNQRQVRREVRLLKVQKVRHHLFIPAKERPKETRDKPSRY